ncbi:MAG TPA: NADH-quinone oxidoreductase subunit I [Armatimonadota bacterium]|jgi:NADH-quinone oxidoreductase chain I
MAKQANKAISYLCEGVYTIVSIVKGHIITLKNMFRKKSTLMYPEVKWPMPPGYRGSPSLPVDPDTGNDVCIGCQACVRVCPTQLITVATHRGEDKKMVVDSFEMLIGRCMFCGLCEEVCPVDAIRMSPAYELADFSQGDLVYDREKLHELGGVREPKPKPEKPEAADTANETA